jgi:hypothetical protein
VDSGIVDFLVFSHFLSYKTRAISHLKKSVGIPCTADPGDQPRWVLANTVVPSVTIIEKNLKCKISRRLERGIVLVRCEPHTGSWSSWRLKLWLVSCS